MNNLLKKIGNNFVNILLKNKKTVAWNFLIIFILSVVFPVLFLQLYKIISSVKNNILNLSSDERVNYPVYQDKKYATKLLKELNNTKWNYSAYVGFRRIPFSGTYTNVDLPHNTRRSLNQGINNSTWFFGGSTMWGAGSEDNHTIPSQYSNFANETVFNFGESGYMARQSLAQLINLLDSGKYKPKKVIFYDGVNEIIGCRNDIKKLPTHLEENKIISKVHTPILIRNFRSLRNLIDEPYKILANKLENIQINNNEYFEENYTNKLFICSRDLDRANQVVNSLINHWYSAYNLTKARGIEFYAFLQPVLMTSNTPKYYLPKTDFVRNKDYNTIYNLIRSQINPKNCKYEIDFCKRIFDGSKWIETDYPVFIDVSHLSKDGNAIVAKNIFKTIKSLNQKKDFLDDDFNEKNDI